jgi:acetylglutamate kinase
VNRPVVCKFGGELVEDGTTRTAVAETIALVLRRWPRTPLVVIHGGGRDIDAALNMAGIEKRQVDGLRITDAGTLDVVVSVLAGRINTQLVAALNAAGVAAVGLTGADARIAIATPAAAYRSVDGRVVDLGRVGDPVDDSDARLLQTLIANSYVPVIASIGATTDGDLLNLNADTLAAHIAGLLAAERLIIAGATPGVLDSNGEPIAELDARGIDRLVGDGTATAGMIAKLRACERAVRHGVCDVLIVDGRSAAGLVDAIGGSAPAGSTRIAASAAIAR